MSAGDLDAESITVHVPPEIPMLTMSVSRTLLVILVELTEVKILNRSPERIRGDR